MKTIFTLLSSLLMVVIFAGCAPTTIYNINNSPINPSKQVEDEQVFSAIEKAAISSGWKIKKIEPGLAEARLDIRDHVAIIEIKYSTKSYSITYKDSNNLDYIPKDNKIHRNYNSWIQELERNINAELWTIK